MGITRREFVALAAALGATLALGPGTAQAQPRWRERRDRYPQGVASGDPDERSVILWTRREPDPGARAHRLTVEVAEDEAFRRIAARGTAEVSADSDWTCRFLAAGLRPGRLYWYRFTDEAGNGSRAGRTVTAPAADDGRPFRFAFVSCQDVSQGACNAYRRMLWEDERAAPEERLSFVLHLGDFFYELVWYPDEIEGGIKRGRRLRDLIRYPDGERLADFHIPVSLADYRTAYRAYLTDPDLQDARARWPFIPVWDNHEFSWQAWQSQQSFGGNVRPAQTKKVAANQAWFEFQPARVRQARGVALDRFEAPAVQDVALERFDDLGLGLEPDNLAAIRSLVITRRLGWGRNADLILTDNRSFMGKPADYPFPASGVPLAVPEEVSDILEDGRDRPGGAPATIRYGGQELPNPQRDRPRQSYLGSEQKAWLKEQLRGSRKAWKIWGHSLGTMRLRFDVQNLPEALRANWAGAGYGLMQGGNNLDHGEIADLLQNEGITGLAILGGDKHSFWAGRFSKALPPNDFEPVGVEFITGAISAQSLGEVMALTLPRDRPHRPLIIHDRPDGTMISAIDMTIRHGVRASLKLKETGDPAAARALSNPEVSPHIDFGDFNGNGYSVVRVTGEALETEFICMPWPLERAETPDGGPLRYRVQHRVPLWRAGEAPRLTQRVVEGTPPVSTG